VFYTYPGGVVKFLDVWYPVQVKEIDKVGRPDIDSFEAMMTRTNRTKVWLPKTSYILPSLNLSLPTDKLTSRWAQC
jgi:hypothetical protein